jgi:hypothetical protein
VRQSRYRVLPMGWAAARTLPPSSASVWVCLDAIHAVPSREICPHASAPPATVTRSLLYPDMATPVGDTKIARCGRRGCADSGRSRAWPCPRGA